MKPVTLKGERIVLRPLKMSDAKVLVAHLNDRNLTRFLRIEPPISLKQEKAFVRKTLSGWKNKTQFVWAITDKINNELIGVIGFHDADKKNNNAELGLWIAPKWQGKGVGSESSRLALDFVFESIGLHRVWYMLFVPNVASKKLIESLGGTQEGVHREDIKKRGKYYDTYVYGILKSEWKKRR